MHALNFHSADLETLIDREWLAVNKIGGFASSTVPGLNARKYHGLLVAAMSPPVRRMVLLSRVEETVICDGWTSALACNEYPGTYFPRGDQSLRAFSADPFPRWAYQGNGWTIEKSLRLLHGENTIVLSYALLGGDKTIDLSLRPLLALRGMHELMYQWSAKLIVEQKSPGHHRVPPTARTPELFFAHDGAFTVDAHWYLNTVYRREQQRGYSGLEDLWNPGVVRWTLKPGQTVHFVCSADPIEFKRELEKADRQLTEAMMPSPPAKSAGEPMDSLLRAADQFVLNMPHDNPGPTAFAIAHYPWAPPSPRQTLIGFTGLFLVPGKFTAARALLLSMIDQLVDGLLPSNLREDGGPPLYNGADVSLWYINAVHHYLRYTDDDEAVRTRLFDAVMCIIDNYRRGTGLGIRVDEDGLVETRKKNVPTTWMDAQLIDLLVTPRAGKPVEVNALWYNALRIAAGLAVSLGQSEKAQELSAMASLVKLAFNRQFWNESFHCCYDVIDKSATGEIVADESVRPNQLFALSLPYPVLDEERFEPVLDKVTAELLTPFGLRTLSPRSKQYQPHCTGNIINRDRAFHQGSVFPWLLGAYVTAYLRVNGNGEGARHEAMEILQPCIEYLQGEGLGQLRELFDGARPHRRGGAIASASAVAELLRAYAEDALGQLPPPRTIKQFNVDPAKIS